MLWEVKADSRLRIGYFSFFYVFYGKIYMYPKTFELPKIFTQAYFFAYFRGNLGACEKNNSGIEW